MPVRDYSHDISWHDFYSETSSFHLHLFLCICLHDTEASFKVVPVQFIPVSVGIELSFWYEVSFWYHVN